MTFGHAPVVRDPLSPGADRERELLRPGRAHLGPRGEGGGEEGEARGGAEKSAHELREYVRCVGAMSHIVHTVAARRSSRIRAVPGPEPLRPLPGAPAIASLLALLVPSRCARVRRAPSRDGRRRRLSRVLDRPAPPRRGRRVPALRAPGRRDARARPAAASRRRLARCVAFGLYAGGLKTLLHAFKFRGWDLLAAPLRDAPRRGRARRRTSRRGRGRARPRPLDARAATARAATTRRRSSRNPRRAASASRRARSSRARGTRVPQSELPAAERRANVEGAFAASASARGRVLVLVDDVSTTGATLFSAARALALAGAAEIRGLVLARTPEPETA